MSEAIFVKMNKSDIIDCDDVESGFFEFSEIRFGRASDYSEECFRRWDSRNAFYLISK